MTQITDRDHELYNKAVTNDWDGRQMLLAIAAAREEGRQDERARWHKMKTAAEHYDEAMDRVDARIKKTHTIPATSQGHWTEIEREECISAIEAAVAEERELRKAEFRELDLKFESAVKLISDFDAVKYDAARYQWLRKNSIAPLIWGIAIRFPGGGSNIRAPKTEAEVDSWIDEEMRRFP